MYSKSRPKLRPRPEADDILTLIPGTRGLQGACAAVGGCGDAADQAPSGQRLEGLTLA